MRTYTLKPDKKDFRDLHYRAKVDSPDQLPKSTDLRGKCSPIVDQGPLGSCTANAMASGLREYLLLASGQQWTKLSRLYLYWHERQLEGAINEDSGAYIRDGMKVLQKLGVAPEADYPYDVRQFTQTPTAQAEAAASAFRISSYRRVNDVHDLKAALAERLPVIIGMEVYPGFETVGANGRVPMPKVREKSLGGHAVLAVGYRDYSKPGTGVVIVRNSWGTEWGDKGYCYIPYAYFAKYVTDMWTGQ